MTKDEAFAIVGMLNATWPSNKLTDAAAIVYAGFIRDFENYNLARKADQDLARSEKWLPSVADFTAQYRLLAARERDETPALGSGRPPLSKERRKEMVAEIRALSAELRASPTPGASGVRPPPRGSAPQTERPSPPPPMPPRPQAPAPPPEATEQP